MQFIDKLNKGNLNLNFTLILFQFYNKMNI